MSDDDEIGSSLSAGKGSNSGYSSGADTDDFLGSFDCAEDELLYVSRHGKRSRLLSMLVSSEEADEGDKLNINCKGDFFTTLVYGLKKKKNSIYLYNQHCRISF